jgi:hypothetical protein
LLNLSAEPPPDLRFYFDFARICWHFLFLLRPSVAERLGSTAPCPLRPGFTQRTSLPRVFRYCVFVLGRVVEILAQRFLCGG